MAARWPRTAGALSFLVLASALTIFATAMVVVAQTRKAQVAEVRELGWSDSVANLVFGFERQFTQFRATLDETVHHPTAPVDMRKLDLRYQIMVSRINLLKSSNSLSVLRGMPEHPALMLHLDRLVESGDALMESPQPAGLAGLLRQMDRAAPEVQGYTTAATLLSTQLLEQQFSALNHQASVIGALAGLQLLLLGAAAAMLMSHHRQREKAHAELKRLAAELGQAKQAAEEADQVKGRFLANMSHELRTPFQGMLGMLQLLGQERLSPGQQELVRTARDSADHLMTLLNDVLDISALDSGRITLVEEAVHLRRLCQDVLNLMAADVQARGLALRAHVDPGVPSQVRGDSTRIKQILLNLLSNAIKFTPSGTIEVDVHAVPAGDPRPVLRFRVTDTGIGMAAETLQRLFRRFELGDATLSRRFGGTGLGLEISRTLARLMGGDLTATSQPGKGSCFELTLRLPVVPAETTPAVNSLFMPSSAAPGLYVLVADDHPINRKYLGHVLESMGHQAMLCENGQQALDAIRASSPFDLVLMDLHMPVLDGLSATRAIRALGGRHASLPILALTADVMGTTRQRAEASGVTAFLVKPIQHEQLADALAQAAAGLPMRRGEPTPATAAVLAADFAGLADHLPPGEFARLVDMFFADESRTVAQLDAALARGDLGAIQATAHQLSGCASVLGLTGVAALARDFNQAPSAARGQGAAHARTRLRQAIGAAREASASACDRPMAPLQS